MRFPPRSFLVAASLALCLMLVAACTTARVIQPARLNRVSQLRTAAFAVAVTGTLMAASLYVAEHAWGDRLGPHQGQSTGGGPCNCDSDPICNC